MVMVTKVKILAGIGSDNYLLGVCLERGEKQKKFSEDLMPDFLEFSPGRFFGFHITFRTMHSSPDGRMDNAVVIG
jgi:hypothetical protein